MTDGGGGIAHWGNPRNMSIQPQLMPMYSYQDMQIIKLVYNCIYNSVAIILFCQIACDHHNLQHQILSINEQAHNLPLAKVNNVYYTTVKLTFAVTSIKVGQPGQGQVYFCCDQYQGWIVRSRSGVVWQLPGKEACQCCS